MGSLGQPLEVFENAMVHTMIPKQELPLIPFQEVLGRPQLGHVLTNEILYT